jgi:ABC-type hemin transport system substrate-binding protein
MESPGGAGGRNGGYVTRAELDANLRPMREDIHDVAADVKVLLLRSAGSSALSNAGKWVVGTVLVGGVGALAALVTALLAGGHHV